MGRSLAAFWTSVDLREFARCRHFDETCCVLLTAPHLHDNLTLPRIHPTVAKILKGYTGCFVEEAGF